MRALFVCEFLSCRLLIVRDNQDTLSSHPTRYRACELSPGSAVFSQLVEYKGTLEAPHHTIIHFPLGESIVVSSFSGLETSVEWSDPLEL
jgi:hypothetical protein